MIYYERDVADISLILMFQLHKDITQSPKLWITGTFHLPGNLHRVHKETDPFSSFVS